MSAGAGRGQDTRQDTLGSGGQRSVGCSSSSSSSWQPHTQVSSSSSDDLGPLSACAAHGRQGVLPRCYTADGVGRLTPPYPFYGCCPLLPAGLPPLWTAPCRLAAAVDCTPPAAAGALGAAALAAALASTSPRALAAALPAAFAAALAAAGPWALADLAGGVHHGGWVALGRGPPRCDRIPRPVAQRWRGGGGREGGAQGWGRRARGAGGCAVATPSRAAGGPGVRTRRRGHAQGVAAAESALGGPHLAAGGAVRAARQRLARRPGHTSPPASP